MHRRTLLATSFSVGATALAGCTGENTPRPDTVTLEIETKDTWSGTTRTDSGTKRISGSGSKTFEWTQPLPSNVRASIKKGPQQNVPLTATFYADGDPKLEKQTSEAYATIILTHTPGTD
jgi:hypothetical protein